MSAARVAWHVLTRLPLPISAASLVGWLLLAFASEASPLDALCGPADGGTIAHRLELALTAGAPLALVLAWLAMLLAMMPPLLAPPLLHVWHRSLTRRRLRAVALFVVGYVVVWLAAGALLGAAALVLGAMAQAGGLPRAVAAILAVVAWQATPLKQVSLNRCHSRPPLAAFGVRAEADALRYGADHGVWCVGACWAFMLVPLAADGPLHWITMGAVTLVAVVERVRAPTAARWGAAWPRLPQPWFSSPLGSSA